MLPRVSAPEPSIPPLTLPDGSAVPITLRRSKRALRTALRLRPGSIAVELVVPERTPLRTALAFLDSQRAWLRDRLATIPAKIAFCEGAVIPVLGRDRVLRTTLKSGPGAGPFRITETTIEVSGRAEHIARRTRDGLATYAGQILRPAAQELAARLGRPATSVLIGNPRSRWGSCSSRGVLRFSWRLVMAPEPVLRYVVAHEVAHLRHMNHSAAFWQLVAELHPGFEAQRAWLKEQGGRLMLYD